eukprot:TRINITY_DN12521_c0_g1_i1.p1 TRINITY_DN12521_c0_g1~~TRINITY_DN12521_c0_g1_i1.p1  ORF type:complete len:562 (-),score=48.04 TRINITY_DN12521_c0_g1_i1:960-2645(-)
MLPLHAPLLVDDVCRFGGEIGIHGTYVVSVVVSGESIVAILNQSLNHVVEQAVLCVGSTVRIHSFKLCNDPRVIVAPSNVAVVLEISVDSTNTPSLTPKAMLRPPLSGSFFLPLWDEDNFPVLFPQHRPIEARKRTNKSTLEGVVLKKSCISVWHKRTNRAPYKFELELLCTKVNGETVSGTKKEQVVVWNTLALSLHPVLRIGDAVHIDGFRICHDGSLSLNSSESIISQLVTPEHQCEVNLTYPPDFAGNPANIVGTVISSGPLLRERSCYGTFLFYKWILLHCGDIVVPVKMYSSSNIASFEFLQSDNAVLLLEVALSRVGLGDRSFLWLGVSTKFTTILWLGRSKQGISERVHHIRLPLSPTALAQLTTAAPIDTAQGSPLVFKHPDEFFQGPHFVFSGPVHYFTFLDITTTSFPSSSCARQWNHQYSTEDIIEHCSVKTIAEVRSMCENLQWLETFHVCVKGFVERIERHTTNEHLWKMHLTNPAGTTPFVATISLQCILAHLESWSRTCCLLQCLASEEGLVEVNELHAFGLVVSRKAVNVVEAVITNVLTCHSL